MVLTPSHRAAQMPVQLEALPVGTTPTSEREKLRLGRERSTVTVIIPTLNEERNIAWVVERIPTWVDEVLIVDGNSVDRTVDIARAVRPDVVVVRQEGHGKGAALRTAFSAAHGDYLVVLDADGSMDPAEIEYYVVALDEGYEFAKGSRYLRRGGSLDLTRIRSLGNRALVVAANVLWGVSMTDLCYGYFALRRDCYALLDARSTGFEIECELVTNALRERLLVAEVPSIELCRQHGISNLHAWRDGRRVLSTLLRRRLTRRPRPVVDVIEDQLDDAFRRVPALVDPAPRRSVSASPGG
jgi:Glycosyl transferase family 2